MAPVQSKHATSTKYSKQRFAHPFYLPVPHTARQPINGHTRITDGQSDTSQIDWLKKTLTMIAKSKDKKALVVATHHPPYSQSGHSGSTEMNQTIDDACTKAGVTPDLFLSAHAHNYQRYTRHIGGKQVPYIVVGTGGMPPQPVQPANGAPSGTDLTYDAAISSYGYLYVTISDKQLKTDFWQLGQQHNQAFDPIVVDLENHVLG